MKIRSFLVLACILLAGPAHGQFAAGDLVVAGQTPPVIPNPSFTDDALVQWFDGSGSLKGNLLIEQLANLGEATFAPDGTVAITIRNQIRFLRSDATVARVITSPGFFPGYLSFSSSGMLFAAQYGPAEIRQYSPEGALIRTFPLPNPTTVRITGIDLDSDQCTLYYLSASALGRLDVCSGTFLPPVTSLPSPVIDYVRVLPDSTLLVNVNGRPHRYTKTGTLLRSYTSGAFRALDVDPRFVWTSTSLNSIQRLDLVNGVLVGNPIVTGTTAGIRGVAVAGEPRAGISAAPIPSMSIVTRIALGGALVALALLALRRV